MNNFFNKVLTTIFRKKFISNYYLETVRIWEGHSYDTTLGCPSYAHPVFIIRKRCWFGEDKIVKFFYYTSNIEEALDELRNLNGMDFVPNEKAYHDYKVIHGWSTTNPDTCESIEIESADSGVYARRI